MRFSIECSEENCCDRSINQIIEIKEYEANLNLLNRKTPKEFGYLLPCFK